MVSTIHCSLKASPLKMAPSVRMMGTAYIPRAWEEVRSFPMPGSSSRVNQQLSSQCPPPTVTQCRQMRLYVWMFHDISLQSLRFASSNWSSLKIQFKLPPARSLASVPLWLYNFPSLSPGEDPDSVGPEAYTLLEDLFKNIKNTQLSVIVSIYFVWENKPQHITGILEISFPPF